MISKFEWKNLKEINLSNLNIMYVKMHLEIKALDI